MTSLIVNNPSTGDEIESLAIDDKITALNKIDKAQALFHDKSRQLSLHQRIPLLERLAELMISRQDQFSLLISNEGGKPLMDAKVEVCRAIAGIHMAIQAAADDRGQVIPLGHQASSAGRLNFTQKFPRGVVLAFSAFNHPLNLIIHQVIPAFATGCPCVVKPAPDTPLSCLKLVATMLEAGIPEDYIRCVITDQIDTADALVRSDKIAFFTFIGSARVGWMLRSILAPGVRCALEHGGVAPCIVTASADLDKAIPAITKGGFYHAGQVCVSTQRVYVEQSIMAEFVSRLTTAVAALKVGDARNDDTEVGPLIRSSEVSRVDDWVNEAVQLGAKLAIGGSVENQRYYQPTVLLEPSANAKVSCQEVFGPVVCVYGYESLDQVMGLVNLPSIAFQASIFSESLKEIYQAYDGFDASAIMVNDHTAFRDDVMPFAGLRSSGLGVGGIPHTVEEMQFEKMMVLKQD